MATIYPDVLVDLTNTTRQEANLNILKPDTLLEQAAKLKAEDMAKNGYFAHTSPEGITPWYWFDQVEYPFVYAGENLAVNYSDSGILHNAWLNSPSHRANIVNAKFNDIGIGTATGEYKGKEAVFVVQLFGKRGVTAETVTTPVNISENTIPPVTNNVLGETVQNLTVVEENNSYLAVQREGFKEDTTNVKEDMRHYSSWFNRISSAPAKTSGYLLIFLSAIIGIALILKIIVKLDIHFPTLIVNGMFIIAVIISSLLFNHWFIKFIGQII